MGRFGQGRDTLPQLTKGFRWHAADINSNVCSMVVSILPVNPTTLSTTKTEIVFAALDVDWETITSFTAPVAPPSAQAVDSLSLSAVKIASGILSIAGALGLTAAF